MTDNVNPGSTEAEEVVGQGSPEPTAAPAAGGAAAPDAAGSSEALEQELAQEQEAVAHQAHHGGQPEPSHPDTMLAAERLVDLQRLQAEYVNYKRRVDRDRAMVQERAVQDVLETLLPVLDDIHAAREHGDLQSGPFAAIADKLEQILGKFGLTRFGEAGEQFDPSRHEALMHTQAELPAGADTTTVVPCCSPATVRATRSSGRPASRSPTRSDHTGRAGPHQHRRLRGGRRGQPGLVREGLLRDPRRPPGRGRRHHQEDLPQARAQGAPGPEPG